MKNVITLFTLTLMLFATTPDVEAKRFGGSRSYGKRYQTAPIQPKKSNTNPAYNQPTHQKSSKKGMLGGMLGGLLMGGLIGSLLSGADFDGLKMMDILLLAGIAFALFKIFQIMRSSTHAKPQYATANSSHQPPYAPQPRNDVEAQTAFAQSHFDIPMSFPPNFDQQGFVNTARGHYQTIQYAWYKGDLATIKPYMAPDIFREIQFEYDESIHDTIELSPLEIRIIRAEYTHEAASISLAFLGDCYYAKENTRKPIKDVWHLARDLIQPNAPWLIVGIEDRTED